MQQFEGFFVNGMSYDRSNPLFLGLPDKSIHVQVIEAYYGRLHGNKTSISWKTVTELVDGMFSKLYSRGLNRRKVDFYGNDGVCLFKYFVNEEDPQRVFSWTVLAINFFRFVCISLSYLYINMVSVESGKKIENSQIRKRNKKVQRKISIIIATDFCCWVPFVAICCLHSFAVFDATPWYALFSIVILPINSVINPLLYDNTLSKYFTRAINGFRSTIQTVPSFLSRNELKIELENRVTKEVIPVSRAAGVSKETKFEELVAGMVNEELESDNQPAGSKMGDELKFDNRPTGEVKNKLV